MKDRAVKTFVHIIIAVLAAGFIAGCNSNKELFTVDFQQGQTLRYKFVSTRDVVLDLGATADGKSAADSSATGKTTEKLEMIMAYSPVEISPYGPATVKATCESIKVERKTKKGVMKGKKDPIESLAGKSFSFKVLPTGKIEDNNELIELLKVAGEKAMSFGASGRRIKDPDMIDDFIVSQWFLWDSISSIENAVAGVAVGQSWNSKLLIPNPMVIRRARTVEYMLRQVRQSQGGRLAVIASSFGPADSVEQSWPIPYSEKFSIRGKYGMLRGFKVLQLQGNGEEIFNIDLGRTERYDHQYQVKLKAIFPLPLKGINPRITIDQKLTMELIN